MNDAESSGWYTSDEVLVGELRRFAVHVPQSISIHGYDSLCEIARGGQGVVYSAVQRSTRRRVAIKVMLDGALASGAARRRFEREIELVATLKDPSIVGVYDSGLTPDGQLYLVMEYVQGLPLDHALAADERSDAHAPIRGVLEIMAVIADAVQHAHQRGVIHRDLKPSNILVDANNLPHILDFGLAKLERPTPVDAKAGTHAISISGQFMGSVPWSSPEQAAGNPDNIDSRTDVYSLGVILYQLLTGKFPYDVTGGLKATLDHITTSIPTLPRTLRHEIDNDLSTVLNRALAKEPERRYQSAGELSADLRAYLAGELIAARRDSAWYTLRRTMRRYRIIAIAGVCVLAATVVGLLVSLLALNEARTQRRHAQAQTTIATGQAQRSRALYTFVSNMLTAADPGIDSRDMRVVDVLDDASTSADATLAGQDEARASVRSLLSTAYRNLGEYDKSLHEADLGIAIFAGKEAETSEELLLLKVAKAATLTDLEHIDEARLLATQASDTAHSLYGDDDARSIEADATLAVVLDFEGKVAQAEKLKRDVWSRSERVFGKESREALTAAGNLGHTLYTAGKFDETIELLEDVIARSEAAFGMYDITTTAPMSTLPAAYEEKGYTEKALAMKKDVWERFERSYGPDNPSTLVLASNYADSLYSLERYEEGLPIAKRALDGLQRTMGEGHTNAIRSTTMVASFLKELGRPDEALALELSTIDIAVERLGAHDTLVGYLRNNVSMTYRKMDRFEQAEAELRRAIEDCAPAFPAQHPMPDMLRYNLAATLRDQGRMDEATELLRRCADAFLEKLGPDSDWTRDTFTELVEMLENEGKNEEASQWRERLPDPNGP